MILRVTTQILRQKKRHIWSAPTISLTNSRELWRSETWKFCFHSVVSVCSVLFLEDIRIRDLIGPYSYCVIPLLLLMLAHIYRNNQGFLHNNPQIMMW